MDPYDEYQDDVLIFKDSDRESIQSYFELDVGNNILLGPDIINKNLIDTPTRLVNHSN